MLMQLTTKHKWGIGYGTKWGKKAIRKIASSYVSFFKQCSTIVSQIMGGG